MNPNTELSDALVKGLESMVQAMTLIAEQYRTHGRISNQARGEMLRMKNTVTVQRRILWELGRKERNKARYLRRYKKGARG